MGQNKKDSVQIPGTVKHPSHYRKGIVKIPGLLSSSIQAVFPAPLHCPYLQQAKNSVLRLHKIRGPGLACLDTECLQEVQWWKDNLVAWNGKALLQQTTDLVIETDASRQGWGAHCQGELTGGRWLPEEETSYHINCLELLNLRAH